MFSWSLILNKEGIEIFMNIDLHFFKMLPAILLLYFLIYPCPAAGLDKREKVFILPFKNETEIKQYFNADIYKKIFSRSFYAYLSVIPESDMDFIFTNETEAQDSDARDFAVRSGAQLIIFGKYHLTGYKAKPDINVEVSVYDAAAGIVIFRKTYETSTEQQIFDSINRMIEEVMVKALKIEIKRAATLEFRDFRLENRIYRLYVNDKLIASPSNSDFSMELRVIPGTNYTILLKNESGSRILLKKTVILSPDASTNIGYKGFGTVRIGGITSGEIMKKYHIYLDGVPAGENYSATNVRVDVPHSLLMTDDMNKTNYYRDFDLYDGETVTINPEASGFQRLHVELIVLDYDIATLFLEIFPIDSHIYAGIGSGFSFINSDQDAVYFISPMIETGYYIIGDAGSAFRIGAGLIFRANFVKYQGAASGLDIPLFNYGIFASADYMFISLRPECYIYIDADRKFQFSFALSAGLRY